MKKSLPVLLSAVLLGVSRLPFFSGWLAFVALVPMLFYFEKERHTWKELVRDAFIFSAVFFCIWMHWIYGVTGPGFAGIILFYIAYYFLVFAAVQLVWQKLPRYRYIGFVLIFLTFEHLQNYSEFRFSWLNLGYALSDYTVLLQAADLGGVVLLSMFILMINVFVYKLLQRRWHYFIWIAVLMAVWTGYGIWCLKTISMTKTDESVTIMQPSILQEDKWEEEQFDKLYQKYLQLSEQAAQSGTKLLIWPEAAIPAYVLRQSSMKALVQDVPDRFGLELFTGFPDVLPAPGDYPGGAYYYNAATMFRPYQMPEKPYYKIVLVPVAERMPYMNILPFLWKLQFGQANWEFGTEYMYYRSGNVVFSPQICFEIAFAGLNRKMSFRNLGEENGGEPAKIDFLVNITNDAWFGKSVGPWIHAMLTKFRAIENRIQIYRSANTGISMAVDPLGRIVEQTSLYEVANISPPLYRCAKVPLFYHLYWWPLVICLLAALLILIGLLKRRTPIQAKGGHR
jgi:apolipoprotein N-acyltransferase